jgi:hypothetical protein
LIPALPSDSFLSSAYRTLLDRWIEHVLGRDDHPLVDSRRAGAGAGDVMREAKPGR